MTSTLPLDTRQARIARHLLETVGSASVADLAAELKLTPRMVRYNLDTVESILADHGLRLSRQSGVGLWVEGTPDARAELLATLDRSTGSAVLDPTDRRGRILLALLLASPDALRSEALEGRLGVSRPTIRRDMREVETWLEHHRLHLRRMPGRGVSVVGSEIDVRGGLLALVLEIAPDQLFQPRSAPTATADATLGGDGSDVVQTEVEAFIAALDLATFRSILSGELDELDDSDPTVTTAALYLAITSIRIRAGRAVRLGAGRLRSLLDHPASASATRIAAAVERTVGMTLGRMDIAAITESLLGLTQLVDVAARPEVRTRFGRFVAP